MSAPGPAGAGEERWWQGTGEAIARMVHDGASDRTHAVFAERLATGEYRTRVAVAPPVVNLGLAQAPGSDPAERGCR